MVICSLRQHHRLPDVLRQTADKLTFCQRVRGWPDSTGSGSGRHRRKSLLTRAVSESLEDHISISSCCLYPRNLTVSSGSLCWGLFVHSRNLPALRSPAQHPHCVQNTLCTIHIWQKENMQAFFHSNPMGAGQSQDIDHQLIHQWLDFALHIFKQDCHSHCEPLKLQAIHNDLSSLNDFLRASLFELKSKGKLHPSFPFRIRWDSQHTNSSPQNVFFPKSSFPVL